MTRISTSLRRDSLRAARADARRELPNGFANRFIFFWAEGDKVLPFSPYTPNDAVDALTDRERDYRSPHQRGHGLGAVLGRFGQPSALPGQFLP